MSVAPAVLTEPILTTREAQPVVLVSSEEILTVRTPAYSKNASDLSWLIRQPSGSAICSSYVELILDVSFTLSNNITVRAPYVQGTHDTENSRYRYHNAANAAGHAAKVSDYGFWPELLPVQNKCVRNAVLTINGSSQSLRMSEMGKEYCLLHMDRNYANKIGGGINDYTELGVYQRNNYEANPGAAAVNYSGRFAPGVEATAWQSLYADNKQRQMQHDRWMNAQVQGTLEDEKTQQVAGNTETKNMIFREPLFLGPFSAFQGANAFPAWSAEAQKSPGLLHLHTMQLQLAMEDGWGKQLYLAITNQAAGADNATVTGVNIHNARLQTKWHMPPPRMVSAALTQTVSYASFDVLRFIAEPQPGAGMIASGGFGEFTLNAVSFPYMPSLFVFSIAPLYQFSTDQCGNRENQSHMLEQMKGDKRCGITHMDLTINTSAVTLPRKGGSDNLTRRINARNLYNMTMQNVANYTEFPYSFDEWMQHCCIVALSPSQLSGTLNSPNIRGSVVVQGKVYYKNMMGHPMNVSRSEVRFTADEGATGIYAIDAPLPRYQCVISGYYSNRALVLDAKSGLVSENTFSAAFNQNLRLGTSSTA